MLPISTSIPGICWCQTVQFYPLNQHSWMMGALMFWDKHNTLGEETMITKDETSNTHDEEYEILGHL